MKFHEQKIKGVWLIEPEPYEDERGIFSRRFCQQEFRERDIETRICQTNLSQNYKKYTLRGFHYQIPPHEESKTLYCVSGEIYNVVVDLRPESESFLEWTAVRLSRENKSGLHVPAGCANAYLTLADDTTIHYYMSEYYKPNSYRGFRYNDPMFSVKWISDPAVISQKDLGYADFDPDSLKR